MPDDRAAVDAAFQAAVAAGTVWDIECRVRRADGAERHVWTKARIRRDAAGRVERMLGIVGDQTAAKLAGEELARQRDAAAGERAKLTAVIHAMTQGVFLCDGDGGNPALNPAGLAIHGLPPGEESRRTVARFADEFDIWDADGRLVPVAEWPASRALRGEAVSNRQLRVRRRATGHEFVGLYSAAPVAGPGGGVRAVVVAVNDVTDLLRAQARSRESEGRLRLALTAARMVAWEYDPATGAVVTSENAAAVFGLPPGAGVGHVDRGFALLHPDDVDGHRAAVAGAVERAEGYVSRFRAVRPDTGAVQWMEEHGHPVRGPGGAVRLVGIVMDVSARTLADQRLARLTADAERERRLLAAVLSKTPTSSTRSTWRVGSCTSTPPSSPCGGRTCRRRSGGTSSTSATRPNWPHASSGRSGR